MKVFKLFVVFNLLFSASWLYGKSKKIKKQSSQKPYVMKYFSDLDLPVGKGTEIQIIDYDQRLGGVFQGISVKEPGEGWFFTRKEYLLYSNPELAKAMKNPISMKGRKFTLRRELATVLGPEPLPETD